MSSLLVRACGRMAGLLTALFLGGVAAGLALFAVKSIGLSAEANGAFFLLVCPLILYAPFIWLYVHFEESDRCHGRHSVAVELMLVLTHRLRRTDPSI